MSTTDDMLHDIRMLLAKHEIHNERLALELGKFVLGHQHSHFKRGMRKATDIYRSVFKSNKN